MNAENGMSRRIEKNPFDTSNKLFTDYRTEKKF